MLSFTTCSLNYFEEEIPKLLRVHADAIERLISTEQFQWELHFSPIEQRDAELSSVMTVLLHLHDTCGSEYYQLTFNQLNNLISEYYFQLLENKPFYNKLSQIAINPALSQSQQAVLALHIKGFKLNGGELETAQRNSLQKIMLQLNDLTLTFSNNITKSLNAWSFVISDRTMLNGIPETILDNIKDGIHERWILHLQPALYHNIMRHADNIELRKTLFLAYNNIASDVTSDPAYDNNPIMLTILRLRQKAAQLLGFTNFVELALSDQSLTTRHAVLEFINNCYMNIKNTSQSEYDELKEFAKKQGVDELSPWDISYFSHQLKITHVNINNDEVKFTENKVFLGIFSLVETLFGVTIKELDQFDKWHDQVRLFSLYDRHQQLRGYLYFDLYARTDKKPGAWCTEFKSRGKGCNGIQLPVVAIITNFYKDENGLTHPELIVLFHEFGHALQKILTVSDHFALASDHAIPLDMSEVISLFMEHWCYEDAVILPMLDTSSNTGDFLKSLKTNKHFQYGIRTIHDIALALFDIKIHSHPIRHAFLQDLLNEIKVNIEMFPSHESERFVNQFTHIFSANFAAGYYSYLFSEQIANRVFHCFEKNHLFCSLTGKRFLSMFIEHCDHQNLLEIVTEFEAASTVHTK